MVLFGGAFDPPHLGHTLVIEQVFKQIKPDELWLLPCFGHTFQKNLSPSEQRVEMVRLLIEEIGNPRLKLNLIEIERQSTGSTYQTWQWLSERYPDYRFAFVMGSDNLKSFTKWQQWEKLLSSLPFYIYIRQGFPPTPWYEDMILLKGKVVSEVSSTQVRQRIKSGEGIRDLVSKAVETYIRHQDLYR